MNDIYQHATRTIAWLDPRSKDSKLAMDRLRYVSSQVLILKDNRIVRAPDAKESQFADPEYDVPYDASDWSAIKHLVD
jgi:hypothetical protein